MLLCFCENKIRLTNCVDSGSVQWININVKMLETTTTNQSNASHCDTDRKCRKFSVIPSLTWFYFLSQCAQCFQSHHFFQVWTRLIALSKLWSNPICWSFQSQRHATGPSHLSFSCLWSVNKDGVKATITEVHMLFLFLSVSPMCAQSRCKIEENVTKSSFPHAFCSCKFLCLFGTASSDCSLHLHFSHLVLTSVFVSEELTKGCHSEKPPIMSKLILHNAALPNPNPCLRA